MGQVHELHLGMLQIGDGHPHPEQRGTGIERYQWLGNVVMIECDRVLVLPAQAKVRVLFALTNDQVCLLVGRIGQFAMQGMRVALSRDPHRRGPAVDQQPAIGFQVFARRAWLSEHGLHGQVPPAELCRPDLLSLEGQHHQFAELILESKATDATLETKSGS